MPRQSIWQHAYVYLAEGALLLLRAACAGAEVALLVLVVERGSALVGALELADVQHVQYVPRHLHLTPLSLAVRTVAVPSQPLSQASTANESLTVAALSEVLKDVCADSANKLLDDFLKLRLCIV